MSSQVRPNAQSNEPRMTVHERPNRYAVVLGAMGILSIVFGVVCIVWPGLTLEALVYLFGGFVAVSGILSLAYTVMAIRDHETWWPALLIGIVNIAASVAVFTYPTLTAAALVYVLAFWAIFTGVFEIGASLVTARFLWLVSGLLSLLVGFILLANPVAGALALVLVIGFYSVVWGIIFVIDAIRMPKIKEIQVF
jgi:uncharacterized membrane protein HdeD (DUF308 family)